MGTINIQSTDASHKASLTYTGTSDKTIDANNIVQVGPAFSVYQSSAQTIPGGTFTKLQLQAKEFDTANAFDSTTNYRFQPTVAGYYQINGQISTPTPPSRMIILIYKNGSAYKTGQDVNSSTYQLSMGTLVYLNGTTDYIELWAYASSQVALNAAINSTWFNGSMIRGS